MRNKEKRNKSNTFHSLTFFEALTPDLWIYLLWWLLLQSCRVISALILGMPHFPPSLTWEFAVMFLLFLLLSYCQAVFFTAGGVFSPFLKRIFCTPFLGGGLSHALRWVSWREMEPAVSSMEQPQLPLTEGILQPPLPLPGYLHPILTYIILETYIQYIEKKWWKKRGDEQ